MKKLSRGMAILLTVCMIVSVLPVSSFAAETVKIDSVSFPDKNFRSYVQSFDTDGDGYLSSEEAAAVQRIDVYSKSITSLEGIEYFPNIVYINCRQNSLTELDVSSFKNLEALYCDNNKLTALNVVGLEKLKTLNCCYNELEELNLYSCTALTKLDCYSNKLTELDVSNNTRIGWVSCFSNKLTSLDLSDQKSLIKVYCYSNNLRELNVSGCSALDTLYCNTNYLTKLNLSDCVALTALNCSNNSLTSIDLSNNQMLTEVSLSQEAKLSAYQLGTEWYVDMNTVVPDKAKVESALSNYNASTGLVSFSTLPSTWTYSYATGCKSYKMEVKVIFANEFDIVSSAGEGGKISPAGTTVVARGSSQSYTITPNEGFKISKLTVDGSEVLAVKNYTFNNVTAAHTIRVEFTPEDYNITATSGLGGTISPSGITAVTRGANMTYTITPNGGYLISDVKVDGESVGAVSEYTFKYVKAAHTINATFTKSNESFTVTASAGLGGKISPSGITNYTYGDAATYTITPNNTYRIADVTVDGVSVGAVTEYKFDNITANHTIAATFERATASKQHTITVSSGLGGSISPNGILGFKTVDDGESITFTITPNTSYFISDVKVDGKSVGAASSYTFENVKENHTINATFARETTRFTVTASSGFGGSITPSGIAIVSHGENKFYKITPNNGYVIKELTVDGEAVTPKESYTFENISTNHTINVTFERMFADVSDNEYYYDAVIWAVNNGITNGTGNRTFEPEANCTRAQVVTFIWRTLGRPEPTLTFCPFDDVSSSEYYYKAVLWAYENGITTGTTETTFSPDAPVTRGQFVTFLWRVENRPIVVSGNPFMDVDDTSEYYYYAVLWAYSNKITTGTTSSTFSPEDTCTRGQVVTFLYRTYKK